jgi:hypothetical protein
MPIYKPLFFNELIILSRKIQCKMQRKMQKNCYLQKNVGVRNVHKIIESIFSGKTFWKKKNRRH